MAKTASTPRLSVDGELLGEVCLAIRVGHRSSREQQ